MKVNWWNYLSCDGPIKINWPPFQWLGEYYNAFNRLWKKDLTTVKKYIVLNWPTTLMNHNNYDNTHFIICI